MDFGTVVRRHPVAAYFVTAFLISWAGALLVTGPRLLHGQAVGQTEGMLMFPVMLLGPSLAGIALTAVLDGRSGLRDLRARLGRWQVDAGWHAALLIPPAVILAVLLLLRYSLSPVFAPHLFPPGILFGIVAGFCEEIGWTGYAFPKMRTQRSALSAAVLLGVLWGLWHAPVVDFLGAAYPHGAYWLPYFLAFVAVMTAIRVLIVWVYTNTQSVLVAQLLHASSTGFLALLSPALMSPAQEALWYAVYAAVLWVVVARVTYAYGRALMSALLPVKVR